MSIRTNLDMDVLRTFVTGFELGSFARAAERLGRSQSAVSTQLRKLEEQVGQPLVQKSGRGLALTTAGEGLLSYAKRLLELNDEAVDSIRDADVEGWVRLGLPQDFAEGWLPAVLNRFSRAHPKVRVEVQVDRSVPLIEKTVRGKLDIALVWATAAPRPMANVSPIFRLPGSAVRIGRALRASAPSRCRWRPCRRHARSGRWRSQRLMTRASDGGWSSPVPASPAFGPPPRAGSELPRARRSACQKPCSHSILMSPGYPGFRPFRSRFIVRRRSRAPRWCV
jgi:DNA-binding transcriptional LysR family regulator